LKQCKARSALPVLKNFSMKTFFLILLSVISFPCSFAQDVSALLKEANRLEYLPNENAAFLKYKEVLRVNPVNMVALCKCSELCSRIGKRQTDKKMKDSYYEAAMIYATTALKIDSLNSEANCVMAMILGRLVQNKGSKEKINIVKEIKKYVDISLQSNPNNFKTWHVLGRWHYELSNLNIFERSAVKLFYGGLPESSIKLSIVSFEKARSIAPEFVLNYLELAKAYHRNDDNPKAVAAIKTMLTLPNTTDDDQQIKETGKKLLLIWQ
jgi:tetratricopeptide (TPR) repeat protein